MGAQVLLTENKRSEADTIIVLRSTVIDGRLSRLLSFLVGTLYTFGATL